MTALPEPTPTAAAAGQAANPLTDAVISAAVDHAIEKAKRHGTSPDVVIGTAPPVPQPGRPPMSQRAVDLNTTILTSSVLTAVVGGSATSVLWASGYADPTVVALVFGAPTALVLALGRLVRRAKAVAPDVHHHHYDGAIVDQREQRTENRGVWVKNTSQQ
ncbi:hypothetical protein AB0N14_13575 [Streptomyces sp. NPDC051104]|uniref:hypothetical protein n=1 Tax=Streptomyces sp. NPDC051104 TaxID=3155044 RepID=UPI00341248CC